MATPDTLPRLFSFVGGPNGAWRVRTQSAFVGEPLVPASHVSVVVGAAPDVDGPAGWQLRGITSNERYVLRAEKTQLVGRQEGLGRGASTRAALIPIRKSPAWWALTQDERRAVFEAQSAHIGIGLRYLPAVARRLHHCRDLGPDEPFDFLTWFEFAPADEAAFDELLAMLRATPEWNYVDREVEIRLERRE
ncbi:MAG: chlorite dismutase [Rhizobiales bacterium]|nr:chlorite dismutase [Rhizobacter sp.]